MGAEQRNEKRKLSIFSHNDMRLIGICVCNGSKSIGLLNSVRMQKKNSKQNEGKIA